ncbi:MAG: hypothetical protein GXY45_11695 [Ramlibacter sp.]|nr:hypothetical protein [Ramlibacter sp.]
MFQLDAQLTFHITAAIVAGALGGFVGGFKDHATARERGGVLASATSIVISVFAGIAIADRFVQPEAWPLALIAGVLAGQLAGSTLDNLRAGLPAILGDGAIKFLRSVIDKFIK